MPCDLSKNFLRQGMEEGVRHDPSVQRGVRRERISYSTIRAARVWWEDWGKMSAREKEG